MNLKIAIATEKYHLIQKSTHYWILASTKAVWGWSVTFGINITQKYVDLANIKLFLTKFWILEDIWGCLYPLEINFRTLYDFYVFTYTIFCSRQKNTRFATKWG